MPSFLQDLAAWAADSSIDTFPADVVRRAQLQVDGMLAAAEAGWRHEGASLCAPLLSWAPEGPCTAVGGKKVAAETACFVNAACSMLHDFDDYLFMGHTGHSAVFASLAAHELAGAGADALLRGVVIANELEGRLGAAVALGPHNGQMWSFIHQAGAAAAGAAILDGSAEAILHAVAMAMYNPPYPLAPGFMGGDAKTLTAAAPAATGLRAAMLAIGGARADLDILEGEGGFLQTYAFVPLRPMLAGLGDSWVTRSLCYKPYPGCAYLQAPLEMLDDIRAEADFGAEDVDKITVRASLLTMVMESLSEKHRDWDNLPPVNVTFSVPLSLAVSLLDGEFSPAGLTREAVQGRVGKIRRLADKIELVHDWDHTADVLQGMGAGLDLRPLIRTLGLPTVLGGFVKMRREHAHFGMGGELLKLVGSGGGAKLLRLFDSPLDWDEFDMSRASFDELRFDFGASMEVKLRDGRRFEHSLKAHRGSCRYPLDAIEQVVDAKAAEQQSELLESV